jgi:hypothetical protein
VISFSPITYPSLSQISAYEMRTPGRSLNPSSAYSPQHDTRYLDRPRGWSRLLTFFNARVLRHYCIKMLPLKQSTDLPESAGVSIAQAMNRSGRHAFSPFCRVW